MSTFVKGIFFINHDSFDGLRLSFGLEDCPTAQEISDQCDKMKAEVCAHFQKHFKVGLWEEK